MGHCNTSASVHSSRLSWGYTFFCGRQLEADYVEKHYSTKAESVPGRPARPAPLLDKDVQSSAQSIEPTIGRGEAWKVEWSPKQKRQFQRMRSWLTEADGRHCQKLRVDLTTANGGDAGRLRRHLQELRRRIKRRWGYSLEQFVIETSEGNGVLHCVWAFDVKKAVWIPQEWLSEQWEKIHGAPIASIKRMGSGSNDRKRVSKYMVTQYMVTQGGDSGSALVRYSWSWWQAKVLIGRGWADYKRIIRFVEWRLDRDARRDMTVDLGARVRVPWRDYIAGWESLLTDGVAVVGDVFLMVEGRRIVESGYRVKG